jgi:signal transduction histidine kinase
VKAVFHGGNRLLFRSFLFLVGGLLLVALVLDFGFRQIQSKNEFNVDRWLEATVRLVEVELGETPAAQRDAKAVELEAAIGTGVQLLARDDVYHDLTSDTALTPLVDADGNTSYLYDAASIDAIIRLGPIQTPRDSLALDVLPTIFYLSIFVVVALWLRPILRDINVISAGANRFAADYRAPPATAEHTTELKALAQNLDNMAARLSGVLRSQKELIAALSHEMRTPLARLRFALAVADDKADDDLRKRLADMNHDVQEIDELIAAMLNYARLDHPDTEMHWQDIPVEAWLERVAHKAPGSIDVATDAMPETACFDPALMELALSNLLVNALKYGNSAVKCTFTIDSGEHVLSVEDDGPGISEADRENVFKAFTRIDDSRNRGTGGYGLGLAVVARVAELHGGRADVDVSPALGGARFSMRWAGLV